MKLFRIPVLKDTGFSVGWELDGLKCCQYCEGAHSLNHRLFYVGDGCLGNVAKLNKTLFKMSFPLLTHLIRMKKTF